MMHFAILAKMTHVLPKWQKLPKQVLLDPEMPYCDCVARSSFRPHENAIVYAGAAAETRT